MAVLFLRTEGGQSEPLKPQEKFYIHAAALLVVNPANRTRILALAKESAEDSPKWTADDDRILQALESLQKKPELREKYRVTLKKRLGDDPKKNSKKLLVRIEKDYTAEKVEIYRESIKNAKLEKGALPWPLCIPFDCCE